MTNTISNQTHSDYAAFLPIWQKCRHARQGEDAIKTGGEAYLPRLDGQSDDQYEAYKIRARVFNAFSKTIDGHIGLATRKQPIIEVPPSATHLIENINRAGAGLADYIKAVLRETLEVNRSGTLIEFSVVKEGATQADAAGARPYLVLYKAEDIRDWAYDSDNKLVYVLLRELIPARERNGVDNMYRYRALEILDGVYTQTLHIDGKTEPEPVITPKKNHSSLDTIPFVIHQSEFDQQVTEPVLIDLVNLVYSHYRLKADHAHALHYVALPTPWLTGVDPESEGAPKTIGPETLWCIANSEAKVGMLEFTGAGVQAIADELKSMEDQMAILGSRVLLPELSEHTATASKLRSISETSDLASIVLTNEKQFQSMLEFFLDWAGHTGTHKVDLPTDFMPTDMDAQLITAMVGAWQQGAFDYGTLVMNLQKAEIVATDADIEEMKKAIAVEDEERMVKAAKAIAANMNNTNEGGDVDE